MSAASGVTSNVAGGPPAGHTPALSPIGRLAQYWKRRGTFETLGAVGSTLLDYVVHHRCRLVFEVSLAVPREPSTWGPRERLLVIGPENIDELSPELLLTLEPERHLADFQSIREGNRLFVVACGDFCVHRGYVCTVDRPALDHDRGAVFFGELSDAPMIRGSETTRYAGHRTVYQHVCRGLFTRVLNEQLRYLQAAGYSHAVLFIMAENTLSIKGVTDAGFHLCRVLNDWIIFRSLIAQKVCSKGLRTWRIFWQ